MPSVSTVFMRAVTIVAVSVSGALIPTKQVLAQVTTVVGFDGQTESSPGSGTRFLTNCYTESGYVFIAVGIPCTGSTAANAFIAAGKKSTLFGGGLTPSLILNSPDATLIDVARVDGGFFTFSSIQLAPFDGAMTTISFTGLTNGAPVTQVYSLLGTQAGFQTFSLPSTFGAVRSIRIAANDEFGEPLVKFDNFTASSVVPEPSTVALMTTGLFVLAAVSYRRGRRT